MAESSVRLCGANRAFIYRFDGELLRVAAAMGLATWDAPNAAALDSVVKQWQHAGTPPALVEYHLAPDIYVDMTEQLR